MDQKPQRPLIVVPRWVQLVGLPVLLLGVGSIAAAAGPVLLLFAVASVVALILNPLVRAVGRLGVPRGVAIAVVYLAFVAMLAGAVVLLVNPIAGQVDALRRNLPAYVDSAEQGLQDAQRWLDRHEVRINLVRGGESVLSRLERDVTSRSGELVSFTRDLVQRVAEGLFSLVLVVVVSIYMLIYAPKAAERVRALLPPAPRRDPERDLPWRIENAVARYVGGQLAFSSIMGASAALMLWVLGLVGLFQAGRDYAVFFGAFFGAMELLPFIGPVLGAIPPIVVALLESPLSALWVALAFVALQQLEGHVVAPNVFGRALRINPLLVIFALLFGGHVAGIVGALVALPLAAMLRELWMYARENVVLEPWPAADIATTEPLVEAGLVELHDRDHDPDRDEDHDQRLHDEPEPRETHTRSVSD
ncbi:AI-2E family transporter [Thermoleophilum album]|jgi:predicted PurR-regulated permease PerM|uniref:AI-2E family transporter n=1 Tax=Thermoleophilum album TaxID=29539 RepID=UPI00237CB532|nr:AI-2E family transporter [Thermoleophilum album]WDT93885.1 AI-2E family transporter [Thermoleophilum album]